MLREFFRLWRRQETSHNRWQVPRNFPRNLPCLDNHFCQYLNRRMDHPAIPMVTAMFLLIHPLPG